MARIACVRLLLAFLETHMENFVRSSFVLCIWPD